MKMKEKDEDEQEQVVTENIFCIVNILQNETSWEGIYLLYIILSSLFKVPSRFERKRSANPRVDPCELKKINE